jgi:hypothetical protein
MAGDHYVTVELLSHAACFAVAPLAARVLHAALTRLAGSELGNLAGHRRRSVKRCAAPFSRTFGSITFITICRALRMVEPQDVNRCRRCATRQLGKQCDERNGIRATGAQREHTAVRERRSSIKERASNSTRERRSQRRLSNGRSGVHAPTLSHARSPVAAPAPCVASGALRGRVILREVELADTTPHTLGSSRAFSPMSEFTHTSNEPSTNVSSTLRTRVVREARRETWFVVNEDTEDVATIPLALRPAAGLRRVDVNGEVAEFSADETTVLVRPRRALRAGAGTIIVLHFR